MTRLSRRALLGATVATGIGGIALSGTAGATGRTAARSTVYLGSYSTSGSPPGHGLDVGLRRGAELSVESTVAGVPDASFFAHAPGGRTMYVTNELAPEGTVTALNIRAPRMPTILNTRSTLGAGPTHLSVHPGGRFLLTANYTDGNLVVHPIQRDGGLGSPTDLVQHTGSPDAGTERRPHAHQVLPDPTGEWILAVDLGTDSVHVYRLDLHSGRLVRHDLIRLPDGSGPRHLAFHPAGHVAYILGELRPEITVARWDPSRGKLSPLGTVPTVPDDAPRPQYPAEIACSSDGWFVYASNRGEDTIATFATDRAGLRLYRIGRTPTGGSWPRYFTLDRTGHWIYVANQHSGTVTWLPRDPRTGLPGPAAGEIAVPSVAALSFV